jgi:microcystin degradation protein MlrC
MNKFITLLTISVLIFGCQPKEKLPRIAVAGLAIESSTFSPAVTHKEAFHTLYGTDVLNYYPILQEGSENLKRAQWFPTLKAKAIPGGIVSRKAYESWVNQTLEKLKENLPYDAMYLELH